MKAIHRSLDEHLAHASAQFGHHRAPVTFMVQMHNGFVSVKLQDYRCVCVQAHTVLEAVDLVQSLITFDRVNHITVEHVAAIVEGTWQKIY